MGYLEDECCLFEELTMKRIRCIDSHTAGEPTRVVLDGPWSEDESPWSVEKAVHWLKNDGDGFRRSLMLEPRGGEHWVGALLLPPMGDANACGVVFFNNVGVLGMCGHGTMGLVRTLAHLGRIEPGEHRIETPAGVVVATWHADGRVSVENVRSHRIAKDVALRVKGIGEVRGDVAYGGNGFFLTEDHGLELEWANVEVLTRFSKALRCAVNEAGFDGVDHVELTGPALNAENNGRNFVLCPGGAFDRSPCGTGTSAKVACLIADGKLQPGEVWRQEGVIGTVFEAAGRLGGDGVVVTVTGQAWITGETTLVVEADDPLGKGIA